MAKGSSTDVRTERVPVPERVATLPELSKAGYSTAVRLDGGPQATPEQWARACLEDAPAGLPRGLVLGWRHVLRLRLGPVGTPDTVLGWYVTENNDDLATISAGSPLLEVQQHFVRDAGSITWVTVVRTHTRTGRVLWRSIAPMHELSMPVLMKRAAKRLR